MHPFASARLAAGFAAQVLLASTAFTHAALAQDATKPPPRTEFSGALGIVSVSGNTSTSTVNADERLVHRIARWDFVQNFGTVNGRTNGIQTTDLLGAGLRADYGLSSRFALYVLTAYDRNKFAGVKNRYAEGLGAVAKVLANDADQLDFEAGYQVTQQHNLDSTSDNFSSLRAATTFKHSFTKAAYFLQTAEFLPDLKDSQDLRINSETALVAPLSTHIAMKFNYTVQFDNVPSLNAAGTAPLEKSDRVLSAGLQVSY